MVSTAESMNVIPNDTITIDLNNDARELVLSSTNYLTTVDVVNIESLETYEFASNELKLIKQRYNDIETQQKKLTKPLHDLKSEWIAFFKPALTALKYAEDTIKGKMITYDSEIERKANEAAAIADEKARKAREKLEARAEKASEKGQTEKADNLIEQSLSVHTPVALHHKPKVTGVSTTTTWYAEITDKMTLIKAVAAGHAPMAFLDVNMKVLNAQAKALKSEMIIPGVKATSKKGISSRR